MAVPRWWGWHQLVPREAARLVADARLPPGALVVDVGAGHGAVTAALVDAGARVIAVEVHPGRAAALRRRFGRAVVVVQADATDLRLPGRPYHVVANPPFAVTTALLRRLLQRGTRLVSARLILPAGAVARWSGPGAPARARWGRDYAAEPGPVVARRLFVPPPPASPRILVVRRRDPG